LSEISVQGHLFPLVMFIFALAIGIELKVTHFRVLFATPQVPILGTLVHTLTFPLLAALLVAGVLYLEIELEEHLLLGIILVAACPSGGFSNLLVLLARADLALSVALTAVSSILSFVTVPFFFWAFGQLIPQLSGRIEIPVVQTLTTLLLMVVVPVGLGMIWRGTCEGYVVPRMKKIQNFAQMFLYLVLIIMLIQDWDNLSRSVGPALPWSLALCLTALASGYGLSRLVGLNPVESATVAIEGSIRNLAVAFLIATTVLGRVDIALLPSVYFIAVLIVGLTFARFWRVRMAPKFEDKLL
jgi:BASS family bile acid:Na+ symporter